MIRVVVFLIAVEIFHLRAVAGVVEIHGILRTTLPDQLFQRRQDAGTRCGFVFDDCDLLFVEAPTCDEDLTHGLDIVDGTLQVWERLVVVDADQERAPEWGASLFNASSQRPDCVDATGASRKQDNP